MSDHLKIYILSKYSMKYKSKHLEMKYRELDFTLDLSLILK